jgi:hypothetical protein
MDFVLFQLCFTLVTWFPHPRHSSKMPSSQESQLLSASAALRSTENNKTHQRNLNKSMVISGT